MKTNIFILIATSLIILLSCDTSEQGKCESEQVCTQTPVTSTCKINGEVITFNYTVFIPVDNAIKFLNLEDVNAPFPLEEGNINFYLAIYGLNGVPIPHPPIVNSTLTLQENDVILSYGDSSYIAKSSKVGTSFELLVNEVKPYDAGECCEEPLHSISGTYNTVLVTFQGGLSDTIRITDGIFSELNAF